MWLLVLLVSVVVVAGPLANSSVLISAKVLGWKFSLKCSPFILTARWRNLLASLASAKAIAELLSQANASCPCRHHLKVNAPLLSICLTLATSSLLGRLVHMISLAVTSAGMLASVSKRSYTSVITIEYWMFSL